MSLSLSAADELQTLRARLDALDGVETEAARPGDAEAGRFQGYVAMRVTDQTAVERLLARLGDTDGCRCPFPRRRAEV